MPGFHIGSEQQDGPPADNEVARSHRWEISYAVTGILDNQTWDQDFRGYAKSVTRPTFEFDKIIMHCRQNEMYLPGKYRFGAITIEFYEPLRDTDRGNLDVTAQMFRQWWSKVVSNSAVHSIRMPGDTGRQNINRLKRIVRIQMQTGTGEPVWTYLLNGAWPQKFEGSQLDYTLSDLATGTCTLVFDGLQEGPDI